MERDALWPEWSIESSRTGKFVKSGAIPREEESGRQFEEMGEETYLPEISKRAASVCMGLIKNFLYHQKYSVNLNKF